MTAATDSAMTFSLPDLNGPDGALSYPLLHSIMCLFYTAHVPATPAWARETILGALGFWQSDDAAPVRADADAVLLLTAIMQSVSLYITPQIRSEASETMAALFPSAGKA